MTPLDRQLANTFRKARWGETAQPACPSCFDGQDLKKPVPDPLTPGLSRYECRVCRRAFSETRGTVLYSWKSVSLAMWAYLVLLGDPSQIVGLPERELQRCWVLMRKLKGTPLAAAWRVELDAAGITVERLRRVLAWTPEAA